MGVAGLEAIRQEVCIGSGCPYGGAPMTEPQFLCSKKSVPQMLGCPYGCAPMAVLQKVSAPNAWVPLWQCPKLQCPYGCAPNAVPLVPASRIIRQMAFFGTMRVSTL